jgi:hypothetical protein
MKQHLGLFFSPALIILISCSDNGGKNEEPAAAPVITQQKQKVLENKRDLAAVGVKGKVEVLSESLYQSNENGQKDKLVHKNVFRYDNTGNKIELLNYRPDGSLASTTKYKYDENNHLVAEEVYLANGTLDVRYLTKTDARGRKIEQQMSRPKGNPIFNFTYKFAYDDKDNMKEWSCYRQDGSLLWKYEYKYDEKGNKSEWRLSSTNGAMTRKHIYHYDDKNNLASEIVLKADSTIESRLIYNYQFDKKGNWTRQTKYENNKAVEIKERDIKYQ